MAFSVRQDVFRSLNIAGVQSIGGLGFQPQVILLWSTTDLTSGTFDVEARFGFGVGISSAVQRAAGFAMNDAVATTDTARRWDQNVLVVPGTTGTPIIQANVSTLWSDGFNVNWATAQASNWVNYLALGGADLTNVAIGTFSLSTVTGTQTVAGVGFQPDAVMLLSASLLNSQLNNSAVHAKMSFGAAQSATKRWGWCLNASDGQNMTNGVDAFRIQRADECLIGLTDTGAQDFHVNHTSMLADGFSLNVIDAPASAYEVAYLALKGGQYDVNVFAKATDAAPVSQAVTTGFSAAGVLLSTFQIASTTAITADTNIALGAGDFTRASNAWQGVADAALSSAARFQGIVPILTCASRAIGTIIFQGSLTGRTATDFNVTWTTNNGVAAQIGYLAMGDAAVAGAQSSVYVTDGMYMNDFPYRGIDRVLTDRMVLADVPVRAEEHQQFDKVLLSDAAFAQAIRQVYLPDAVYLNDNRFTIVDRNILEGVLLADTVVRVLEKLVQDGVILYDRVIGVPLTVAAMDGLYLLDAVTRVEEHLQRESLFLRDTDIRETLRTFLDRLLVSDVRASNVLELSFQDKLLLADLSTKIQEVLIREGLLVLDTEATSVITFIVNILVWARLRAENALGVTLNPGDPFGNVAGRGTDILGIRIGAHKKPDIQ